MSIAHTHSQKSIIGKQFVESARWCNAMQLGEALQHVRGVSTQNLDHRLVQQRFDWWNTQLGVSPEHCLNAWKREFGASEEEILRTIAVSPDFWQHQATLIPKWVEDFCEICALYESESFVPGRDFAIQVPPLSNVAWPWIKWAKQQVRRILIARWKVHGPRTFPLDAAPDIFLPALIEKLYFLIERTLILEVNVARVNESWEEGEDAERFNEFCDCVTRPDGAQPLWIEYPVLARLLTEESRRWISTVCECLFRLERDRKQLCDYVCRVKELGCLASTESVGDPHCSGRAVSVLCFDSGLKLLYKPRPVHADASFEALLAQLNRLGLRYSLRAPRTADMGAYGWNEFITADHCKTHEERKRFFFREGELLAICYFMRVTDLSFENLIAAGEEPVPVDVECILRALHPDDATLDHIVFGDSLLSIGILPAPTGSGARRVDLSAMAGKGGEDRASVLVPVAVDMGKGTVRVESVYPPMPRGENRPVQSGALLDLKCYTDDVADGFSEAFQLLRAHSGEVFSGDAVANALQGPTRFLARRTMVYSKLLRAAMHPNLLRDGLDRDALFTKLWRSHDWRSGIVSSERRDLWNGDIPMFWIKPESPDLITSDGTVVPGMLKESSSEQWKSHLHAIRDSCLDRHLWTIRSSMGGSQSARISEAYLKFIQDHPSCGLSERCFVVAQIITGHIRALAAERKDIISWLDCRPFVQTGHKDVPNDGTEIAPIGAGLYQGLAGMYMLFQYMGMAASDPELLKIARQIARGLIADLEKPSATNRTIGAFSGVGSVLYVLAHHRCHHPEDDFMRPSQKALDIVAEGISDDHQLDFLHGAAGAVCVLLAYARVAQSDFAGILARRCGEYLLDRAISGQSGLSWNVGNSSPLTGLAHGASGFAYALGQLGWVTGDERCLEAARDAIRFENQYFQPEKGNWEDLRDWVRQAGDDRWANVCWCTGAAGIGLARLGSLGIGLNDAILQDDLETAIRTTLEAPTVKSDCLCHGTLGNLDFLWTAARSVKRPDLIKEIETLLSSTLARIATEGFRFEGTSDTIGLMIGLAGCAYALLRFARPDMVPNLLLLQGPCLNSPGRSD